MLEELSYKIDPRMTQLIESKAKEIVEEFYHRYPRSGRPPSSIGYASVYISCKLNDLPITQTEIARKSGKSLSTIRCALLEIRDYLKLKSTS